MVLGDRTPAPTLKPLLTRILGRLSLAVLLAAVAMFVFIGLYQLRWCTYAMPKRIKLEPRLDADALGQRYRQAPDPVGRTHFQVLWLLAGGRTVAQVAQVTGYSRHWVRQLVARYNHGGPDTLGDRRRDNPGGQWLLSPQQKAELGQALTEPPEDGGLWSGPKVAAWMSARLGHRVHPQRGWDYLRLLGYSLQVPRPATARPTRTPRRRLKKTLLEFVAQVEEAHPASAVEVWSFDEHRIGLLPIARRVWEVRGSRPTRTVETRYQWLYLYGFVQPQTGRTHFATLPKMSGALYSQALADFAQALGAGPHRNQAVAVPEGLHLVTLPPCSPELQPTERLWPLTNEPLVNRHFATLDELMAVQEARCRALAGMTEAVRGRTLFHWWPQVTK